MSAMIPTTLPPWTLQTGAIATSSFFRPLKKGAEALRSREGAQWWTWRKEGEMGMW